MSISVQAEQYVLNLALAHLALEKSPDHKKSYIPYVKTLNAQGAAKNTKDMTLAVLAMEYAQPGAAETHTLLVPVSISADMPPFNALKKVQKQLSSTQHTLHNVKTYYVTVVPSPGQKFSDDPALLRQQLLAKNQSMIEEAVPLTPYDNAQLQLQLAQFFMQSHTRDAAYLALENARAGLARIAENAPDLDISVLSQKADALESQLHKNLPYKL